MQAFVFVWARLRTHEVRRLSGRRRGSRRPGSKGKKRRSSRRGPQRDEQQAGGGVVRVVEKRTILEWSSCCAKVWGLRQGGGQEARALPFELQTVWLETGLGKRSSDCRVLSVGCLLKLDWLPSGQMTGPRVLF